MSMPFNRPYVMSIAGFDPTAGAGILADIKTVEANHAYGLGVCTAITIQTDSDFKDVKWLSLADICAQADVLLKRFDIAYVKIGLIESLAVLDQLVQHLHRVSPGLKIIWDPILKASAGYVFHSPTDMDQIKSICSKMYLITPNIPEALAMGTTESAELNAKTLSDSCHVFLKGGHNPERAGDDQLILKGGKTISFKSAGNKISPKHGSGCILSAALAAKLAKGLELDKACLLAKEYTLTVLESNDSLLGFHAN